MRNINENETRRLIPVVGDNSNEYQSSSDNTEPKEGNAIPATDHRLHGLNTWTAAVFIVGEMAGSGVLALPQAVVRSSGWMGIILLIMFCFNSACGGICLGYCWEILEERYPQYQVTTRNPYSMIGYRALGKYGKFVVTVCIQFTLFGTGTVYLLLSSQIFRELFNDAFPEINVCVWLLVIAVFLAPCMWLGSPKDFWIVGVGATVTTICACVLIIIQMIIDGRADTNPVPHRIYGFHDFFLSFGTLLFAFGGASTFPTIQNDMNDKQKFSSSAAIAFTIILGIYVPISVGGYMVFGDSVQSNVLLSLSRSYLITAAEVLLAIHLSLAFLIVINPVCQELEELFQVPPFFCWKRSLLRTMIIVIMVCVGIAIPYFGKILSLIGGSTITLLTFVFPPFFYMKLCKQKSDLWPERYIPLHIQAYLWELICIGVLGGSAATYNAIINIFATDSTASESCF